MDEMEIALNKAQLKVIKVGWSNKDPATLSALTLTYKSGYDLLLERMKKAILFLKNIYEES
jgi:hypothetical protein